MIHPFDRFSPHLGSFQVTPNLPQHGSTFKSAQAVLTACYLALLPIYGSGARPFTGNPGTFRTTIRCALSHTLYKNLPGGVCPWSLVAILDKSNNEFRVDLNVSDLYHNHAPHPSILRNPTWRPLIKNEDVRRTLGMALLPKKRKMDQSQNLLVPQNQPRLPSTSINSASTLSGSSSTSHRGSISPDLLPSFRPRRPSNAPQSFSSSSLATSSGPRSSNLVSTQNLTPSAPVPSFLPKMTSFLLSLDSALLPLASILVTAGFDNPESLTQFCSLDSPIRSRIVEQVRVSMGASGGEEVGKLFELFEKKLKEEMESGLQWGDKKVDARTTASVALEWAGIESS